MILIDGIDIETLEAPELRILVVDLAIERDAFADKLSRGFVWAKPDYQVMPSRSRVPDPTKVPEVVA